MQTENNSLIAVAECNILMKRPRNSSPTVGKQGSNALSGIMEDPRYHRTLQMLNQSTPPQTVTDMRWQKKHLKPPEKDNTSLVEEQRKSSALSISSKMHHSNNNHKNKDNSTTRTSGLKRRTIYGGCGTIASTFSVFLIKCLIIATAYDDKFVNKL